MGALPLLEYYWAGAGGAPAGPPAPVGLVARILVGGVALQWSLNGIVDATDISIEMRDSTIGAAYAELDTTGDGLATTWGPYAGPFLTHHRYKFRIKIVGGASTGLASNEVSVMPSLGLTYANSPRGRARRDGTM